MARRNAQPRWYFSLRSPYSWFCYRELVETEPAVLQAAEWIPVWEPDAVSERMLAERGVELPVVPMSRAKNFYILQDTRRIAKERGLSMIWPVDRAPVWEVAHLAYLRATDEGRGRDFLDRVSAARWERGEDISDPAVIGAVATELGLDPVRYAGAAEDEGLRERGIDVLTRVADDGVFGVPMFVLGREKFWGTDRVGRFLAAWRARTATAPAESSSDERREFAELARAVSDGGHAGGCG
jgi:2-hydroxychromene-2-carboxylate isomerase